MSCPNCNASMEEMILDNQHVFHCHNCGATFFEENGINRIGLSTSQKLSEDKQTDEVSGTGKKCPKDGSILRPISTDFNEFQPVSSPIPPDVALLQCPTCRGIFAYPDDLVKFKQAQEVKINYFKLWQLPIPALKAVLILSLLAAVGLTAVSRYNLLPQAPTRATDVARSVHANRSGPYLFISFQTPIPLISHIVLIDNTAHTSLPLTVSAKPATIHYITTTDVNFSHQISYQIILTDNKGQQSKTEVLPLVLK